MEIYKTDHIVVYSRNFRQSIWAGNHIFIFSIVIGGKENVESYLLL